MKLKKLLVFFLAVAMILGLVACGDSSNDVSGNGSSVESNNDSNGDSGNSGNEGSGEVQNVVVAMMAPLEMADAQLVEDAINEIASERYGVTVTLQFIESGSWTDKINLLLTGSEVDVFACYATPLTTYVKNGQLLVLDDYVANASDAFKNVWTDEDLQGTTLKGHIYAIPNLRNFGNTRGLVIDENIAAEYGIEAGQKLTMDDVSDFLYKVHEKYPERYAIVPQTAMLMVSGWTWDGLGDAQNLGVLTDCGQDTTVRNLFETDDFLDFISYTRQWYEDGLMMADVLSNSESGISMVQAGKAVSFFLNYAVDTSPGCIRTVVVDNWTVANSYAELCYGINSNSKVPDAAWTALQMFYTDEDICTLLVDGIEGTHYVKNDDGTISYPSQEAQYAYPLASTAWMSIYSGHSLPLDTNGATYFEDLIAFNEASMKSKAFGFSFDTTDVTDQYTACSNVMQKYYYALLCGAIDPESSIAQANTELEAAGLNDIIAAKQEQLDAYLAQ